MTSAEILLSVSGLVLTLALVVVTGWYVRLTHKLVRMSGPLVSIHWEIIWAEPGSASDVALRRKIDHLALGPADTDGRFSEWFIAVTLSNAGGQRVKVTQLSLLADDDLLVRYTGSRLTPACPQWLDPHDNLMLAFPSADMERIVTASKHSNIQKVRAGATLGNGQTLDTRSELVGCFFRP